MIYILFICLSTGAGKLSCTSATFPDEQQCQNAAKVWNNKFARGYISNAEWYCQQVRNK